MEQWNNDAQDDIQQDKEGCTNFDIVIKPVPCRHTHGDGARTDRCDKTVIASYDDSDGKGNWIDIQDKSDRTENWD